jgi:hypothetical protein
MRKRDRENDLFYCNPCKMTTRHNVCDCLATCLRCGVEKHVRRAIPRSYNYPEGNTNNQIENLT